MPDTEKVSIHAPAWGATMPRQITLKSLAGFNPRTRVGCDMPQAAARLVALMFQSTHPRGVRRVPSVAPSYVIGFNPRTRVGCDTRWPFLSKT